MTDEDTDRSPHIPVLSQHTRVIFSWLSIFPLVTLGMTLMSLIGPSASWPIWLRALLLTVVVVPISMYLVVPRLLAIPVLWSGRRARRTACAAQKSLPA
jgi:antibiotic biosynthesis monooxygenase (ABM) superfamily enzyme